MSVIVKMRKQFAVWWERSATPDHFGKYTFAAPVEVTCRWDDVAEEFVDATGEKRGSHAIVYPDRLMRPGDRLMRGEFDSDTAVDPLTIKTAYEIRRFDQTPNFKATETLYTAFL